MTEPIYGGKASTEDRAEAARQADIYHASEAKAAWDTIKGGFGAEMRRTGGTVLIIFAAFIAGGIALAWWLS